MIIADINTRNIVVGNKPNFKRLQLIPTRGNRYHRTTILKLSCPEMNFAIGGE